MKNIHEETLAELREIVEKGIGHLTKRTREYAPIVPIRDYTAEEIKNLRERNKYTQLYFSELLGVSIKTVQDWEAGTNKPGGTAIRIFQMLEKDPNAIEQYIKL